MSLTAMQQAETHARLTGAIAATYRVEERGADGVLRVLETATWVRPGYEAKYAAQQARLTSATGSTQS